MKKYYFLTLLLIPIIWLAFEAMNLSDPPWLTDYEMAKKQSQETGKPMLLLFSGSDWCGACMKMKKDIWESAVFKNYATDNLTLMNADFPRMKKNKLDEKTKKQNESLAEQYNKRGNLPYAVLLDPQGKVLKEWEGYTEVKPDAFVEELKRCKQSL